jgi:hypothetical protein
MSINNKQLPLEEVLLQKIKEGEGSLYQIMVISQEYDVDIRKMNKILKKHMDNNRIMWLENKFVIKGKIK